MIKNLVANYVGRIWTNLLGFILIPFYVSKLGVDGYGLIGFFLSLTAILSILDLGIGSAINRELAKLSLLPNSNYTQRQLVKTLEYIYLLLSILIAIIVLASSQLIVKYWIHIDSNVAPNPIRVVQLMGIAATLQFPTSFYQGGLMGVQKQITVNKILIINGTIKGIGSIIVLQLLSPNVETYFIWQIFSSLLGTIIFRYNLVKYLPGVNTSVKFNIRCLNEIWKFAATMSLNSIISLVMTQLDKIILINVLSLKAFGYYSIATTASSAIWLIIMPFNNTIYPKLVQLFEKKNLENLKYTFHLYTKVLSILLIPVCAIMIFFSKSVIFLWLNNIEIAENTSVILSLLTFGTMLNGVQTVPCCSSISFGSPMLLTRINLIQSVLIIPLILLLVKYWGAEGAAISWIFMNLTYIIFLVPSFFSKYFKSEQTKWFINETLYPIVISFLLCFIASYLKLGYNKQFIIILMLITWMINTLTLAVYHFGLDFIKTQTLNTFKFIFNSKK